MEEVGNFEDVVMKCFVFVGGGVQIRVFGVVYVCRCVGGVRVGCVGGVAWGCGWLCGGVGGVVVCGVCVCVVVADVFVVNRYWGIGIG